MSHEREVKFFLADQPALRARLDREEAQLLHPRTHETNLRFDDAGGNLLRTFQVLRLRQDQQARLTYKGPGRLFEGVRDRVEIETTVGDFETAREILQALGYRVVFIYEKFRATYQLGELEIVLDELPYGNFAEIEGPDGKTIQTAAARLGLNWASRLVESYLALFQRVQAGLGLNFRDLTFDNFTGISVPPGALGATFADRQP